MATEIHEQLVKYLADAHSIEVQALAQLRTAPELAGDPQLSHTFGAHPARSEVRDASIVKLDPHVCNVDLAREHG